MTYWRLLQHKVIYTRNKIGNNLLPMKEEMKAYLGINYVMGINKLPTIADYWRVDEYIGNEGIKMQQPGGDSSIFCKMYILF